MISRVVPQKRFLAVWTALSLIGMVAPKTGTAQSAKPITVIGHDYAFDLQDTVTAGPIVFGLQNRGTVRHEVIVVLLKKDRTASDYLNAKTPEERRLLNDGLVGLIMAEPGHAAPGQLLSRLQKGRDYLLLCNLRDAPDKPPHSQLGMIAVLHVK